jgi:hypothetical protein
MKVPYTLRARMILALDELGSAAVSAIAAHVSCSYNNAVLIIAELERDRLVMPDRERVWPGNGRLPTYWKLGREPSTSRSPS